MRYLAAALTAAFLLSASSALACQYPLEAEREKWATQGLIVGEVSAVKLTKAIEVRYGETVAADQVLVLSKTESPNVVLVFVIAGCPQSILVLSRAEYQAMIETAGA